MKAFIERIDKMTDNLLGVKASSEGNFLSQICRKSLEQKVWTKKSGKFTESFVFHNKINNWKKKWKITFLIYYNLQSLQSNELQSTSGDRISGDRNYYFAKLIRRSKLLKKILNFFQNWSGDWKCPRCPRGSLFQVLFSNLT
jgi:hypothetical protein